MAPYYAFTIEAVVASISQGPLGAEFLVAGGFNADLAALEGNARDEEIYEALATVLVEDISDHFLPRRKLWLRDRGTCSMIHGGKEVHSWTDYILVKDRCLLHNMSVRYARHNK